MSDTITPEERAELRRVVATAELCCLERIPFPHSGITRLLDALEAAEADLSRVKGAGIEALRRAEEAEAESADIGTCDVCGFMFDLDDGRARQDGDYSNPGKSFCPACVARDESARLRAERDWLARELWDFYPQKNITELIEAARRAVAGEGEVQS